MPWAATDQATCARSGIAALTWIAPSTSERWLAGVGAAVDPHPPRGVRAADWERVLAAWRQERAEVKAPPDPRRPAPLGEWVAYLDARRSFIPCYQDRRRQRQYIGSGQAEKARGPAYQKDQGMIPLLVRANDFSGHRT